MNDETVTNSETISHQVTSFVVNAIDHLVAQDEFCVDFLYYL